VGDGTVTWRLGEPTPVAGGFTFRQITVGRVSCGLTPQGAAYCWGDNYGGSVGDGTTEDRLVPTAVAGGLQFRQLSAGIGGGTCGLTVSGAAYCWGPNTHGQVGDGTISLSRVLLPRAVVGGLTFRQLSADGSNHTCALTQPGVAYCWGSNVGGQLGDGTTIDRGMPTAVLGGLTFK
jgi:alpha-tubulin suppressor-like RCC1 family protein